MNLIKIIKEKALKMLGMNRFNTTIESDEDRLTFISDREEIAKNRIKEYNVWYEGDSDELLNFYTRMNTIEYYTEPFFARNKRSYFWSISSTEEDIKRTHSGQAKNIIDTLTAIVGMIGLVPTLEAIKHKKDIALANKETLVCAGSLVMSEAKKNSVKILPVDSEHSAIFQSLNGENYKEIEKIILTASGGPFRGKKKEDLMNVTKDQALKHPNWSMGRKISIDSSTLMNKGLEVIEAKWLFDVDPEQIDVVVHPQSIIHSMVQFNDSSVIAQLGCPDMRLPIQYALTYPARLENGFERLDLTKIATLTFEEPDLETFPCLSLAYETLKMGGTYSAVLNSANEVLVEAFLQDKIGFYDIPKYIKQTLDAHNSIENATLEQILEVDRWTREYVTNLIR